MKKNLRYKYGVKPALAIVLYPLLGFFLPFFLKEKVEESFLIKLIVILVCITIVILAVLQIRYAFNKCKITLRKKSFLVPAFYFFEKGFRFKYENIEEISEPKMMAPYSRLSRKRTYYEAFEIFFRKKPKLQIRRDYMKDDEFYHLYIELNKRIGVSKDGIQQREKQVEDARKSEEKMMKLVLVLILIIVAYYCYTEFFYYYFKY